MKNRLHAFVLPVLLLAMMVSMVACAAPVAAPAPAAEEAATAAPAAEEALSPEMAELVAAAQAEGELTTIALPHDWCNYGEVIEGLSLIHIYSCTSRAGER